MTNIEKIKTLNAFQMAEFLLHQPWCDIECESVLCGDCIEKWLNEPVNAMEKCRSKMDKTRISSQNGVNCDYSGISVPVSRNPLVQAGFGTHDAYYTDNACESENETQVSFSFLAPGTVVGCLECSGYRDFGYDFCMNKLCPLHELKDICEDGTPY